MKEIELRGESDRVGRKLGAAVAPGLIPAIQPVPALALRQQHEGEIQRFTRFGTIDSTLEHTCYGGMATLSRIRNNGKVIVKPHPMGFRKNKVWHQAEVLIGAAPSWREAYNFRGID